MKHTLNVELREKFKEHKKRGLTQPDLAIDILCVSVGTVSNWLNKRTRISGINNVAVVRDYIAGNREQVVETVLARKGGSA